MNDDSHVRKRGPRKDPEYLRAKGAYRKDPQRDPARVKRREARWLMWLLTDTIPPDAHPDDLAEARCVRPEVLRAAWAQYGPAILAAWIEDRPGRPSCWWKFDAPEMRARVGGRGTPFWSSSHWLGLPRNWFTDFEIAYYTGTARDIHGAPCVGTEHFIGREPPGEHFDRNDPPTFESQAAYLKRHALLGEAEAARLTAADFQPVVLPTAFWPYQGEPE
jgi:hypothetical protein